MSDEQKLAAIIDHRMVFSFHFQYKCGWCKETFGTDYAAYIKHNNDCFTKHHTTCFKPSIYFNNGELPNINIFQAKLSRDELEGFYKGNVLKYIVRAGNKPGSTKESDYRKALYYMDMLAEMYKSSST